MARTGGTALLLGMVLLASAQDLPSTPTMTTDSGNLNVNLPVDGDLNVVRGETISMAALADTVRSLEVAVANMQSTTGAYSNAESNISTILHSTHDFAHRTGSIQSTLAALRERLTNLQSEIDEDLGETHAALEDASAMVSQNITDLSSDIHNLGDSIMGAARAHAACGVRGMTYNSESGSCVTSTLALGRANLTACASTGAITYDPAAKALRVCDSRSWTGATPSTEFLPSVAHRGWNNQDGTDSGWVSNRLLTFDKEHDSTYIKVNYYDNWRVHGRHGSYANWNVYICRADGSDCQPCSDPGPLNLNRFANTEHGHWDNDHYGGLMTGICRRRGSSDITSGRYRLQVLIDYNRNDIHTGHGGQYGSFQVTEVNAIQG